jgi:hypothetical protein
VSKESGRPSVRQASRAAPRRGGTRGKSADPAFVKLTSYIRRDTHLAVKKRLLDEDREISELVQDLMVGWLNGEK